MLKESVASVLELGLTADDYIHESKRPLINVLHLA